MIVYRLPLRERCFFYEWSQKRTLIWHSVREMESDGGPMGGEPFPGHFVPGNGGKQRRREGGREGRAGSVFCWNSLDV